MSERIELGKAVERLERIVQELERNEPELEDAVRLFDEGMDLIKVLERQLDESEGRLKQVLADRRGRLRHLDFEVPE